MSLVTPAAPAAQVPIVLAGWLRRTGLDLFRPPNVGGWPSGENWLAPRMLVARTNYAHALVNGRGMARSALDAVGLAEEFAARLDVGDASGAGDAERLDVFATLLVVSFLPATAVWFK